MRPWVNRHRPEVRRRRPRSSTTPERPNVQTNKLITWGGLQEFKLSLRNMPKERVREATIIVDEAAETTAKQLIEAYPVGPDRPGHPGGNLRRGVKVVKRPSQFGVHNTVLSTAK